MMYVKYVGDTGNNKNTREGVHGALEGSVRHPRNTTHGCHYGHNTELQHFIISLPHKSIFFTV